MLGTRVKRMKALKLIFLSTLFSLNCSLINDKPEFLDSIEAFEKLLVC